MGPLVVCLSYTAMTGWFRGRTLLVFKNVIHGWFVNKRWSYSTMMGLPSILVGLRECWAIDTGKLPIWKAPNYDFVILSGTMTSTFGIGKILPAPVSWFLSKWCWLRKKNKSVIPWWRSHWIKATSFVTSSGQRTLCQQCQPIGISPQWTRCGHQEHQRLPHCLQCNQRQISAMVLEWGSWPSWGSCLALWNATTACTGRWRPTLGQTTMCDPFQLPLNLDYWTPRTQLWHGHSNRVSNLVVWPCQPTWIQTGSWPQVASKKYT